MCLQEFSWGGREHSQNRSHTISHNIPRQKKLGHPGTTPEMQGMTWNIYNTLAHFFWVDYSSVQHLPHHVVLHQWRHHTLVSSLLGNKKAYWYPFSMVFSTFVFTIWSNIISLFLKDSEIFCKRIKRVLYLSQVNLNVVDCSGSLWHGVSEESPLSKNYIDRTCRGMKWRYF